MDELQIIQSKIYEIRNVKVMLDKDLAELYQVTTGNLNKAIKRNIKRFPPDFMFQQTKEEFEKLRTDLIFQNGISRWGGIATSKDFISSQFVTTSRKRRAFFSSFWTIIEGISMIWPKTGSLSIQVEEEMAYLFGISPKSP